VRFQKKEMQMKKRGTLAAMLGVSLAVGCGTTLWRSAQEQPRHKEITVASYYFGQYHPNDPRNLKERGGPWSDWELIKAAKPRFPGHAQPKP